jgi:transposase
MPYRKISRDVKIAAIKLYERELLPLHTILDCLDFSRRTFFRILKLWHETGDVIAHTTGIRGRLRTLDYNDVEYLLRLIDQNPDYFLDELLYLLKTNRFISVHYVTIHRALERAGISHKKLKKVAAERNERLRADFIGRMAKYDPGELGFLDETSKDERTPTRAFGWAKKGRRATKAAKFVRGRRLSTEALLTLDGIVACTVVEGSMTKALFLEYLEHNVVSVLELCTL